MRFETPSYQLVCGRHSGKFVPQKASTVPLRWRVRLQVYNLHPLHATTFLSKIVSRLQQFKFINANMAENLLLKCCCRKPVAGAWNDSRRGSVAAQLEKKKEEEHCDTNHRPIPSQSHHQLHFRSQQYEANNQQIF